MFESQEKISRRDFLKLVSFLPTAWFTNSLAKRGMQLGESVFPNVLILVFDAWSASNLSLYGYPRNTMSNLEKFAERATVYHNHISAGTFTTPGVASILTGLYPWSHRALHLDNLVVDAHAEHQMFSLLKHEYAKTLGYSQNKFADKLLDQFGQSIDDHHSSGAYNIYNYESYDSPIYSIDAIKSIASLLKSDASFFLGPVFRVKGLYNEKIINESYLSDYPKGIPSAIKSLFLLESVVARATDTLSGMDTPFLGYLHFFPPHEPYRPKTRFYGKFRDNWRPPDKGIHPLAIEKDDYDKTTRNRTLYDEFLASWDFELGRLFDFLDESGLRENSYIIITSDHGEMFERGESGHATRLIYEPLLHVPLIISKPGQETREDIYQNTSSIDILPTLAHLTGLPMPPWVEGQILPTLGGAEDKTRSVFSMDAKENSVFTALEKVSISLTKDRYRLTHYKYQEYQGYEFYDLENDSEEINDLYPLLPAEAQLMQNEMLDTLADVNRPFLR